MRNKYSKEFEEEMINKAHKNSLQKLWAIATNKYNYNITKRQLYQYLSKRKIRYKDYNANKVRNMGDKLPIGTEYTKPDGMVLVKIAKDRWEYKQRLIYSKYHNIELTSDDYIIFLDQDRTNFNINNLKKITRRESSIVANQELFSKDALLTETGIEVAKLIIKIKDRKKEQYNETNNN